MSCAAAALITGFAVAADLGWVALLVAGIALAVLVIQQATRAIGKNKD